MMGEGGVYKCIVCVKLGRGVPLGRGRGGGVPLESGGEGCASREWGREGVCLALCTCVNCFLSALHVRVYAVGYVLDCIIKKCSPFVTIMLVVTLIHFSSMTTFSYNCYGYFY